LRGEECAAQAPQLPQLKAQLGHEVGVLSDDLAIEQHLAGGAAAGHVLDHSD
jgi:hypothetical protein